MVAFFKTQRDKLNKVVSYYTYCDAILNKQKQGFSLGDVSRTDLLVMKDFHSCFQQAFARLDGLEKEFLDNDYINKKDRCWWQKNYERSTYYRIKRRTINNFLSYLNDNK